MQPVWMKTNINNREVPIKILRELTNEGTEHY